MDDDDLTELRVLLTSDSVNALMEAASLEVIPQTDVVNRALQVYRYLVMERTLGKRLAWVTPCPDSGTATMELFEIT